MFSITRIVVICYREKKKKTNMPPTEPKCLSLKLLIIGVWSTLNRFNPFPYNRPFNCSKTKILTSLKHSFFSSDILSSLILFFIWLDSYLICFLFCLLKESLLVLWLRTESFYLNTFWPAQWYNSWMTASLLTHIIFSPSYFPLTFIEHWCKIHQTYVKLCLIISVRYKNFS